VEARDFQALVEQLGELTAGQRDALVEAIKRKSSVKDAVALIETRFAAAPRCGHCRSEKVATWADPLQMLGVWQDVQRADRHAVGASAAA
jgi:hypothetical protein